MTRLPRPTSIAPRPFAYSSRKDARGSDDLLCDRVRLRTLARTYGTPLYVYSASNIRQRVRLFADAFAAHRHTLCYAVKANSNLSILRLMATLGAGFDIVSGGELERVRVAARSSLRHVVFSGVGKTAAEIDAALAARILVFNVESAAELDLIEQRSRHFHKRAPIALRVNPDVFADTHPYISTGLREHKFGIAIDMAAELYHHAARSRHLEPLGIGVHIGSQIRKAEPFGQALGRVCQLAKELESQGIALRHIDAGGGLGISYELQNASDAVPFDPKIAVDEYARQVRAAIQGFGGELLLEPGRFIVAQAGALVTQVLSVKRNGAKTFVIVDAAMNDLIRPALYQAYHEIVPLRREPTRAAASKTQAPSLLTVDVVGPVCETGDFFAKDRELPALAAGDFVAVLDAGAYGMSLSSNYNSRGRAAEVLVDGRTHRLIRHRETIRDQLAPERGLLLK